MLPATEPDLARIQAAVRRARKPLRGEDEIGLKVGAVLGQHKMAKHFELAIADASFDFARIEAAIAAEATLDGFYVIRTNVPAESLDAAATVRAYKSLAQVERAFRTLKTVDLQVRPIHHWLADRVRAHVFLCMLAYYVVWHMRRALAPILFDDHDREAAEAVARLARRQGQSLGRRQDQGYPQAHPRWPARAQLPDAVAGSRHAHTQHRAHRPGRPGRHARQPNPTTARRLQSTRHPHRHHNVGRPPAMPAGITLQINCLRRLSGGSSG